MSPSQRKRKSISLEEKLDVINAYEETNSQNKVASRFDLDRSTVQTILRNKKAIIEAIQNGGGAKRARLKQPTHVDLEKTLVNWMERARSQNLPVSGDMLKVSLPKGKDIGAVHQPQQNLRLGKGVGSRGFSWHP